MTKPMMVLDVDGVLNVITWAKPTNCERGKALGYRIFWKPDVIQEINNILEDGDIDVVWLTTWGREANKHLVPMFGLSRELRVLRQPPKDSHWAYGERDENWWKLKAMQSVYSDNGRRFAWFDDDLLLEPVARDWCGPRDVYVFAPLPHLGVTRDDIKSAASYLRAQRPKKW